MDGAESSELLGESIIVGVAIGIDDRPSGLLFELELYKSIACCRRNIACGNECCCGNLLGANLMKLDETVEIPPLVLPPRGQLDTDGWWCEELPAAVEVNNCGLTLELVAVVLAAVVVKVDSVTSTVEFRSNGCRNGI